MWIDWKGYSCKCKSRLPRIVSSATPLSEWIYSCVLCWNWFTYIKKCLCESICKAEVGQEASEASGMQFFTAEVSDWKLFVDHWRGGLRLRCDVVSGFTVKYVSSFLDFFKNWPLLFEIFLQMTSTKYLR